jgi:hypothetical protein
MSDHLQPDVPLMLTGGQAAEPASSHNPASQLATMQEWVHQYDDDKSTSAEKIAAEAMMLLLLTAAPFDLARAQADARRVLEVWQAFVGRLACLDAQVNGFPEV